MPRHRRPQRRGQVDAGRDPRRRGCCRPPAPPISTAFRSPNGSAATAIRRSAICPTSPASSKAACMTTSPASATRACSPSPAPAMRAGVHETLQRCSRLRHASRSGRQRTGAARAPRGRACPRGVGAPRVIVLDEPEIGSRWRQPAPALEHPRRTQGRRRRRWSSPRRIRVCWRWPISIVVLNSRRRRRRSGSPQDVSRRVQHASPARSASGRDALRPMP